MKLGIGTRRPIPINPYKPIKVHKTAQMLNFANFSETYISMQVHAFPCGNGAEMVRKYFSGEIGFNA